MCAGAYRTTAKISVTGGDDGFVDFTVAENAPGIDPTLSPQLLQRIVRRDESRPANLGSTRVELVIVVLIANAHRGSASVESARGPRAFGTKLPLIRTIDPESRRPVIHIGRQYMNSLCYS